MSHDQEQVPEHRVRAILAVKEFARASTEASAALRAIPGDDRTTAIVCARSLDRALVGLASLLAEVPIITGVGRPGKEMRASLDRSRAKLSEQHADVARYRTTLDDLAETEARLAESSAEAQGLRDQISARERAIRSAEELPGLRRLAEQLEADVAALDVADASEVSARLAAAIEQVASLTRQQRAALSDAAAAVIGRAETATRELEELRKRSDTAAADVARHESDAAQLKEEHGETLAMLIAWGKADLALADGMSTAIPATGGSALNSLRSELRSMTQRLTELDVAIGPLLEEHASAYKKARRIRSA
jgi:DNA repair exonuclease SbcCD ATPase subunit